MFWRKRKRVIVSGFSGDNYREMTDRTWPGMKRYADKIGADFMGEPMNSAGRPCSWGKLPLIARALANHEEALWLDADVSVDAATRSVFESFSREHPAAACWLVDDHGNGHFNCGVLLVRRPFLETILIAAMQDDLINSNWWEQTAINRVAVGGLIQRLGDEWNVWRGTSSDVVPQFRHACGLGSMAERIAWLEGGKNE